MYKYINVSLTVMENLQITKEGELGLGLYST
jgi:hypothetical protein